MRAPVCYLCLYRCTLLTRVDAGVDGLGGVVAFELGVAENLHVSLRETRRRRVPAVHEEDHVLKTRAIFMNAVYPMQSSIFRLALSLRRPVITTSYSRPSHDIIINILRRLFS